MRNLLFILPLALLLVSCREDTQCKEWPEVTKETRPWTRWWWMGSAVDKANLTYNLEEMAKAGLGGVEITPIYGVKGEEGKSIPFLSPEWMEMLAYTEAEAKRLGMGVDMNMGTGWPFGGPGVTPEDAATKAVFRNDSLFIGKTMQRVKRAAPGGEGLVMDHLDAGAVGRYLDTFDKAFTSTATAFPHSFFNDSYEVYGADWTPSLLDFFEKRRGYRLQDHFPEFLQKGETDASARIVADYRETMGELLQENFTDQWVEWAHKRGISIRNQAHGSPANLIDLYATVDIPECETFGITDFDIPLLRKDSIRKENDGDPTTLKYASSAAHITGKPFTSAETFTWLTEHFRTSLSQCKPEIDQMFASGVNHVYFHGTTYSPKEAAWPGWKFYAAVDMSPTNTIWRDAPPFFHYVTRVQSFLQYGKPDADFLLYLPIYDMWHEQRGDNNFAFAIHDMRERLPGFYKAVADIREKGYDVDYISDRFLQTTTVEHGVLVTEGGAGYAGLILPSVKLIPLKTLEHIRKLAEQGAKIVFSGGAPEDVPGYADLDKRRESFKAIMSDFPEVYDLVYKCGVRPEAFKAVFGGDYIRRKHANGYHYFLTMLHNNPVDGWVPLAVRANSAMFFDPLTGKTGKAAIRKGLKSTEVYIQLKPGQSIILKTFTHKRIDAPEWEYYKETGVDFPLDKGWEMEFADSEPAINKQYILAGLGSWTDLPDEDLKRNMGTARYRISFDMKKDPKADYLLSLGDVRESARVVVNGQVADTLFSVPFETRIGPLLKEGENILEVEVTNLPANRISDYDRRGVNWRIFYDTNIVNIAYKNIPFDTWSPVPSGLLGPVSIKETKKIDP